MRVTVMVLDSKESPHEKQTALLFQPSGNEVPMPVPGNSYRLKIPTLAIIQLNGQNCPTTVPSGAVIKVINRPLNGNRLVNITWEGKAITMFASDIRERGVKLEEV